MRGPNKSKVGLERRLRRSSTDAEVALWFSLRDRRLVGCGFIRQEATGRYIADFVCRERKLVAEVDGGQHAESDRDNIRDAELRSQGYRILRFWNTDVLKNRNGVLEVIAEALRESV
jgi:very-short-patch-repair endonuclease